MEKLLTLLIATIMGSVDDSINSAFSNLIDMCFNAEDYLTNVLGLNMLNFSSLKTIILSFSITLIVLKFLKKGFDIYIAWVEGDSETPPLTYLTYFARAIIMAVCFPILYEWLITVATELGNQVMTALDFSNQYELTTQLAGFAIMNIFMAIVGLIVLIMLFLLYIQFLMRGMEMFILKMGFPLACIGLVDSDKGIFAPYMKKFFQSITTVIVQIALAKLSIMLILSGQLVQATAALLVALKTPKFLAEFMLVGNGGGISSVVHNASKTIELYRQLSTRKGKNIPTEIGG